MFFQFVEKLGQRWLIWRLIMVQSLAHPGQQAHQNVRIKSQVSYDQRRPK